MQKEIKYTGFSETPSDYECPDGDLATVVGMVPEDEAMKPIQQPTTLFKLPAGGWSVVFIHKNTGFTHYIVCHEYTHDVDYNEKDYFWIDTFEPGQEFETGDFNQSNLIASFQNKEVYELNALGNMLMILTEDGVYYFPWKGFDNKYDSLGNHLPEMTLSFGLDGTYEQDGYADVVYDPFGPNPEGSKEELDNSYKAVLNTFIANQSIKKGKFIFPFLIRYAYRLYDETITMHSVPVLMLSNCSDWAPFLYVRVYVDSETGETHYASRAQAPVYSLCYQALFDNNELAKWKDFIKSVDIYITAPLYTYDQAGDIPHGGSFGDSEWLTDAVATGYTKSFAKLEALTVSTGFGETTTVPAGDDTKYKKVELNDWKSQTGGSSDDRFRYHKVPCFDSEDMVKKIKNNGTFYLIKSIPLNELATERTAISIPEGYLDTLTNREVMTDDYNSHDNLIPKSSFAYNQRINFCNLSRALCNPAPPIASATFTDNNTVKYDIYVYIEEGEKTVIVKADSTLLNGYLEDGNPFVYFYYPNPNAKRAIIKKHADPEDENATDVLYEFPLTQHETLHGAVYFEGWNPAITTIQDEPAPSTDRTVLMPNKLYTSEVANPFIFKPRGIQTVGVGTILGVRPIVKAMSLAQYGQHDLYVFSTDGVWSLEVDSEGYMQHPHLATPDIVLGNGDSISQIDGAVLFATDRGIMLISGSDSICISDMLNSTSPFIPIGTTPEEDLLPGLRNVAGELLEEIQMDVFRNFITDCRMTYDYPHQRIIVYSPTHDYAYVYSLKSKQWGMMPSKIESTPLNYPAALAMVSGEDGKNVLVDYSKDDIVDGVTRVENGLIITRPLKLDYPDVLKTVDTVIQRGKFQTGHVKSILYGSRDLLNWQLVWSSVDQYLRGFSGTPYKYFRLALLCNLEEGEDLMGCTVQFTPRLTDQLR